MSLLAETLIYLLSAVISVPLSRRLGFGSVLGYLAAGIVIGPFGFAFVHDPEHILHFAELGVVFLLFAISTESQAQDWGTIRGQIVMEGKPPAVAALEVERDKEFCGRHDLKDESLQVHAKNGGVKNVVVWLYSRREVPVHPDLQKQKHQD